MQNDIIHETVHDPSLAAFLLYERDEIESGIKYDDDVKARLMSKYYVCMGLIQLKLVPMKGVSFTMIF